MLLDLKFSIGTLSLSSSALIAALYGMNLKNFIEESDVGFFGISVSCFTLALFVSGWGIRKLRRVQKVSMWGESGVGVGRGYGSRGSWRNVDDGISTSGKQYVGGSQERQLLETARRERSRRLKDERVSAMKDGAASMDEQTRLPVPAGKL